MTWEINGFQKDGEALTHEVNLDDALGRLLRLEPGERGPVYLGTDAMQTLSRIIAVPLDPSRGRFILEQEPPRGWMLREVDDHGFVDETDVDWELTRVFAELLGEDLEYVRGPAFGAAFPLDRPRFAQVMELFGLDLDFDDAAWFLEVRANHPLDT